MSNVLVVSLGCAKNTVDSENMIYMLREAGYGYTENIEDADVIIVNTCAFIGDAKEESVSAVVEAADIKNSENKKLKVVVSGCLAQRYAEELKEELPEVDAFIGTGDFYDIVDILKEISKNEDNNPVICTGKLNAPVKEEGRYLTTPSYSAYIKLAEGCDKKCTYCIIPSLRGNQRSRKFEDIISEAKILAEGGVKELILIAQDVGEYGTDLYGKRRLSELLYELNSIENLHWIRVLYIYPETISEELIKAFDENDKVLNYLDIPLQHINSDVLRKMGRRTSGEDIIKLIKMIRNGIQGAKIRSTFITGFPGESEENHKELVSFLEEYGLDRVGFFKFSKEEGTVAYNLHSQISEDVKDRRFTELMEKQEQISDKLMENFLGKTVEVLIEEKVDGEEFIYTGRSYMDTPEIDGVVYVYADRELDIGEFVGVKIDDSMEYDLIGRLV